VQEAFDAAANSNGFKLMLMFDYLGGDGPWNAADVKTVLNQYATNESIFKYSKSGDPKPVVSTFEGGDHIGDWADIKASVPGGITFIPSMQSLGPAGVTSNGGTLDGFFNWDMWPHGPNDVSTSSDDSWRNALGADKVYMMGVSPWFYTNLPGYGKAFVWRGDSAWHDRWIQAQSFAPDLVQIVTWNDFGESHYIGPIVDAGVPSEGNADARPYVNNMPHVKWLDILPYYTSLYKNGQADVTDEKLVYWYRLTPAAAADAGGVTGNNCPSPINKFPSDTQCFNPGEVSQDKIFFTALVKNAGTQIKLQVGGNAEATYTATAAGAFHTSQPFNGQNGVVKINMGSLTGNGAAIQDRPSSGSTNFNVWVGSASS
jgi:glucan endo-1,3-alpha-glucosidase